MTRRAAQLPMALPAACPALAVCGWSGAGKTTLLEAAIPALRARGLRVAAVKHDAHGLAVDRPGKDSDRLFRAGADVVVRGPDETFARRHGHRPLETEVAALATAADLVLVEGHKGTPLPKVWLAGPYGDAPPADVAAVLAVLPRAGEREARFLDLVSAWLPGAWRARPVLGGVLVGGRSTRMGRPKQLLEIGGVTLAERAVRALAPHVASVVLLGDGPVPEALAGLPRVADLPDGDGPLAAIRAALRWHPAAWVFAPCDLPHVTPQAIAWLLGQRAPGRWAVLPRVGERGVEPLLALYEPQMHATLEALAAAPHRSLQPLAGIASTHVAAVPAELARAWMNANSPEDLAAFGS